MVEAAEMKAQEVEMAVAFFFVESVTDGPTDLHTDPLYRLDDRQPLR